MRGACSTGMRTLSVRTRPGVRALLLTQAKYNQKAFAGRVTDRAYAPGRLRWGVCARLRSLQVRLCA